MNKRRYIFSSYWLILLFAAVLYGLMSLSDMIWADEAYTFAMIRHSFPEIWRITAADSHPPLYYFAVKLFSMPFGYSEYSVRLFSGICYFLILAVGGSQIHRLFDRKTGLLFMALLLLYPFALDYATEARMYALGALTVFLNALFAYRVWLDNRGLDWAVFTLAGVASAYTHYYALASAGMIYGLLFLCCLCKNRKLLKPWLIASLATVLLYLPWLKCLIAQLAVKVTDEYWIAPITLDSVINDLITLLRANDSRVYPLFFGLLVAVLFIQMIIRKDGPALLALAVPALTMLLGIIASAIIRPVYVVRYLSPCAPLMIFFLAFGISNIRHEQLFTAVSSVLLVAFFSNLPFVAASRIPKPNKIGPDFVAATDQAQAYVVELPNSIANSHISQVVSCYQSEKPIYVPETLGAASPYPNIEELSAFQPEELDCFAVLTDPGSQPSMYGAEEYECTSLGVYHEVNTKADIWLVTRQSAQEAEKTPVEETPAEKPTEAAQEPTETTEPTETEPSQSTETTQASSETP